MDKKLIKKVLFGVGLKVTSVEFLNKGTSKDSYIVFAGGEKYVLKLFKAKKKSSLNEQIKLMRKINEIEKIVICLIHDEVLDFGDMVGYVYEFVEGRAYADTRPRNKLYNFGRIVGHFNKVASGVISEGKTNEGILEEVSKAKEIANYVSSDADFLRRKAKRLVLKSAEIISREYKGEEFRTGLTHGDLHQENVYSTPSGYVVIDMDGLGRSILVGEIATYLSYISYRSLEKYEEEVSKLVWGYESEFRLKKREKELLPIILIIRKLGEITYLLKQEYKGKLSFDETSYYLGHTTRKLDFILKNYSEIREIFSRI